MGVWYSKELIKKRLNLIMNILNRIWISMIPDCFISNSKLHKYQILRGH